MQVYILLQELPLHTHHTELLRCSTCHPHPGERETKRKREGMIERETGRWRDGDEGGACSGCLDVNNAPEGSAENCQLLIFVVSFNHLRLCFLPTPPFTNPPPPLLPHPTRHAKKSMNILHICISSLPPSISILWD